MATKSSNDEFNFGAKLTELETIASALDNQDLDLDKGIVQYEQGMKLVKELKAYLDTATNRIEAIRRQYDDEPAALVEEPRDDDSDSNVDLDDIPF